MGEQQRLPSSNVQKINTLEEFKKTFWVIDGDRYKFTRDRIPNSGNVKILDIGCCYGYMFEHYDHKLITSIDLDDYSHIVPNFIRCDAKKLPFDNDTFDYASLGEVLEHQMTWEDCKQVLSEAVRVSKNVILSVPNEYLWSDSCEKFFSYEDDVKRHNGDLVAMAKRSAPFAKDWDKQFTHIFHHHHFSPYEVEDLIKSVTDREYNIYILPNCGNKDIGMVGTTAAIIYGY